jgi:hypothetical protein
MSVTIKQTIGRFQISHKKERKKERKKEKGKERKRGYIY